jgi:biotin carboxylase
MTTSVVFVESNTTGTGALMLSAAARLGMRPILLTADASRYRFGPETEVELVDTARRDDIIRWCRTQAPGVIRGITSSSEHFVETAASVAEELGLRSVGSAAIRQCRNKFIQRSRLSDAGLRCPRFAKLSSTKDVEAVLSDFTFPVVVKPCFGSGSVGVRACRDNAEVLECAERLLAAKHNERGMAQPNDVLVEEFVEGDEYSIEVFSSRVLGCTRKHLSAPPWFVEIGHDFPAKLSERSAAALTEAALAGLDAMHLSEGPAHVEAKLNSGGAATLIEINARLAGGFIPELVRLATGVDLLEALVEWACGGLPVLPPRPRRCASIRFSVPKRSGALRALCGLVEAEAMPGIHAVQAYKAAGEPIVLAGDFRDRIAHVIAVGDTSEETAAAAAAGSALLHVDIAEPRVSAELR